MKRPRMARCSGGVPTGWHQVGVAQQQIRSPEVGKPVAVVFDSRARKPEAAGVLQELVA